MDILEFETSLNDDVIHVPAEIAAQVSKGMAVRVSITPIYKTDEADEAWQSILAFIGTRQAPSSSTHYIWQRDDAYEHLTPPDAPDRAD